MDTGENSSAAPIFPEEQRVSSAEDFLKKIFFTPEAARTGLALESDPGFRMFLDFLKEASDRFGLDLPAGFASDRNPEMSDFFPQLIQKHDHIRVFDSNIDYLKGTHRFSEELFPSQSRDLFHFAHFFSQFVHFGMYREAEDGRPYFHHIDEVTKMVIQFFEALSNSFLLLAQLHDTGEDFYHKNSLLRKMGLKPEQVDAFRDFLMEYFDRVFPSLEIPSILRPDSGELLRFSEILTLLSKIRNKIPGSHKDRYRDLIEKLYHIFQHTDNNAAAAAFLYYFVIKCCDGANNFISYTAAQNATMPFPRVRKKKDPGEEFAQKRRKRNKERQMRGITQGFFLPALKAMGAWIPAYYLEDALRFPNYEDRSRFQQLTQEYRSHKGSDTVLASFQNDFFALVQEEYSRRSSGGQLRPDDYEIRFWDRAMHPLRNVVRARRHQDPHRDAESLSEMETNFLHIVEVTILTTDARKIPRLEAAIDSVFASFAPHEESTAFSEERKHPLLQLCKISSDRVPRPDRSKVGYVVRYTATLKNRRRDIGGVVPAMFLNQDYQMVPGFLRFLDNLKADVCQLRANLEKIESEFQTMLSFPIEVLARGTRQCIAEVYQAPEMSSAAMQSPSQCQQHRGFLGSVSCDFESLHHYTRALSFLYSFLKEQALTLLRPKIVLRDFVVHADGQDEYLSDLSDQVSSVPEGSNSLYVLARYFPKFIARRIDAVTVKRGSSVFSAFSRERPDNLQYLSLVGNDLVDIWLAKENGDQRFKSFLSFNIGNARDFSRNCLYSTNLRDM